MSLQQRVLVYAVPAVLLYAVVAWALWHTPNSHHGMYANQDGDWAAWNAEGILQWGRFLDLSPFNPLSGFGSMFLPNLPWLNPAALALALPAGSDVRYLASYTIYYFELFASTALLYRGFGLSAARSSLIAQLYIVLLFPPFHVLTDALSWYAMAPVNAHLAAVANMFLWCFLRLGTCPSRKENLWMAIGAGLAIVVGLFSAPVTFLTYGPVYGLMAAGILVMQRDAAVRRWRLVTLASIAVLLFGIGFFDYLRASAGISARTVGIPSAFAAGARLLTAQYWIDASAQFSLCQAVQEGCWSNLIVKGHAAAVAGALLALLWRTSGVTAALRIASVMFLVGVVGLEISANVHNLTLFGKWHIIAPVYFVWSANPFLVLFAALLVLVPFDILMDRFPNSAVAQPTRWHGAAVVALLFPIVAAVSWVWKIAPMQPPPPPGRALPILGPSSIRKLSPNPIVAYLIEHARLADGDVLRGYVVTNFGVPRGHVRRAAGIAGANMTNEVYISANPYLEQQFGSKFKEMDLWRFNIPTVEEYGQWVNAGLLAFLNRTFTHKGDDLTTTQFVRIYRIDVRLLAALGVRFIITDVSLEDSLVTLRATMDALSGSEQMYLYEISGANLGNYSPVQTTVVQTMDEASDALRTHGSEAKDFAVVFDPVVGSFARARKSEIRMMRDGFRATAEADGDALLLLPIQYSRCLRVESAGASDSAAVLLRANGVQTLVRFHKTLDIKVRIDFGLLGTAGCRLDDRHDLVRFKVLPP